MTFLAEAERNLTQKWPRLGRRNKPGKRAVKSSCNDAPGVRAEKGSCEGVAVAAQGGCLEQEGNAPRKSRLFCVWGEMLRPARFLSGASGAATSCLRKTRCAGCAACTTAAAVDAGSEFRLLACRRRDRLKAGRGPQNVERRFFRLPLRPSMFFPKNLEILPLTRLPGEGRTGVGHRRWAQQRTPALSPQTEQRLPSTPASAVPAFPSVRPPQLVLHPHSRPAEGAAFGGNRGARGELFPPHAFPVFPAFPGAEPRGL